MTIVKTLTMIVMTFATKVKTLITIKSLLAIRTKHYTMTEKRWIRIL